MMRFPSQPAGSAGLAEDGRVGWSVALAVAAEHEGWA